MEKEATEQRLNEALRRSTVVVRSYYALTATAAPVSPPAPEVDSDDDGYYVDGQQLCGRPVVPAVLPVVLPEDLTTYPAIVGNGFFFGSHGKDIITAATNVLIDPRQLANNNRYPYVSNTQPIPAGTIPNTITRASRIVVSVNHCGEGNVTKNYDARLMAVDGAGNIAWLRICKEFKDRNIKYGKSFDCPRGATLYSFMGSEQFLSGSMLNNTYTSWDSSFQAEHIATEFEYERLFPGAPVVDENFNLVGMLTGENNGPSEDFMRYVTEKMAEVISERDDSRNKCNKKVRRRFTEIVDNLGNYFAFRKAYLGILWTNVNANTFVTTVNPVTGVRTLDFNAQGLFDQFENCDVNQGIQIVTLAGNTSVLYTVLPGATPVAPFTALVNSTLTLSPTDIILGVNSRNKKLFGNSGNCRAPGLYTWRIDICKETDIYSVALVNTCNALKSENNVLVYMPLALDYPYRQTNPLVTLGPGLNVAVSFTAPL